MSTEIGTYLNISTCASGESITVGKRGRGRPRKVTQTTIKVYNSDGVEIPPAVMTIDNKIKDGETVSLGGQVSIAEDGMKPCEQKSSKATVGIKAKKELEELTKDIPFNKFKELFEKSIAERLEEQNEGAKVSSVFISNIIKLEK